MRWMTRLWGAVAENREWLPALGLLPIRTGLVVTLRFLGGDQCTTG
jgi:hypothetical protein